jgi:hypothetical protein
MCINSPADVQRAIQTGTLFTTLVEDTIISEQHGKRVFTLPVWFNEHLDPARKMPLIERLIIADARQRDESQ